MTLRIRSPNKRIQLTRGRKARLGLDAHCCASRLMRKTLGGPG